MKSDDESTFDIFQVQAASNAIKTNSIPHARAHASAIHVIKEICLCESNFAMALAVRVDVNVRLVLLGTVRENALNWLIASRIDSPIAPRMRYSKVVVASALPSLVTMQLIHRTRTRQHAQSVALDRGVNANQVTTEVRTPSINAFHAINAPKLLVRRILMSHHHKEQQEVQ